MAQQAQPNMVEQCLAVLTEILNRQAQQPSLRSRIEKEIRYLPAFEGKPGTLPAFLTSVERALAEYGDQAPQVYVIIYNEKILGPAKNYLETAPPATWEECKLKLKLQYKPAKDQGQIMREINMLKVCGAMVYAGAAGHTAEELSQGLKLIYNDAVKVGSAFQNALEEHADFLSIANKIYLKRGIRVKPEFHEIVTNNFFSEEENIHFEQFGAEDIVNEWVKNKTQKKIKNFIQRNSLDSETIMLLVNAIYFKGEWQRPFKGAISGNFWISESEKKEVEMMGQLSTFNYGENSVLDAKIIELKYKNSEISMLVMLPKNRTGLNHIEQKLSTIDLLKLPQELSPQDVLIWLPKFQIEFSVDLEQIFSEMGMSSIFSGNADFSNMLIDRQARIDKAIHKAFIAVNELGTEAGAATGFKAIPLSVFESFEADHPFLFVIKSKTAVLFIGRYVK